jgi:hypothetical protein
VTKAITSRAVTSHGSLPTTEKNTFKSCAYAFTVFGRARPATNSRNSSIKLVADAISVSPSPQTTPEHRVPHAELPLR